MLQSYRYDFDYLAEMVLYENILRLPHEICLKISPGHQSILRYLISPLVVAAGSCKRQHTFNMEEPLNLPSIHAFPPFFTRQPNEQTYVTQKTTWTNLILSYYRSNRLWRIDVNQETIEKIPIFSNKQIQRNPL